METKIALEVEMYFCVNWLLDCYVLLTYSFVHQGCEKSCKRFAEKRVPKFLFSCFSQKYEIVGKELIEHGTSLRLTNFTDYIVPTDIEYDHKSKLFFEKNDKSILFDIENWQNYDRQLLPIEDTLILRLETFNPTNNGRTGGNQNLTLEPYFSGSKAENGRDIHAHFLCTTHDGKYFPHFDPIDYHTHLEPVEPYSESVAWCSKLANGLSKVGQFLI